jgi:hypothetical protein
LAAVAKADGLRMYSVWESDAIALGNKHGYMHKNQLASDGSPFLLSLWQTPGGGMISYEDFDLRLHADGGGFVVAARRGSQSASEPFKIDLLRSWDPWRLVTPDPWTAAAPAGPRPADGGEGSELRDLRRQAMAKTSEDAKQLGSLLFDTLIRGRIRDLYQQARGSLGGNAAKGLRVRILIDSREERLRPLLRLPWEILYDRSADAGHWPALDPRRPVVRAIDSIEETSSPAPGPLRRVLLVQANPRDLPSLDVEDEGAAVERILARISIRPAILRQATRSRLADALGGGEHQIVHFMGHGTFDRAAGEGVLALTGEHGGADLLRASDLAGFFAGRPMPRLVLLASCHSGEPGPDASFGPFAGVAAALVAGGIPAVVAMQTAVRDSSAIRFTERLYRHLVDDDPIEAAVSHARNALRAGRPAALDWAVPVLFVRGQEGARQPGDERAAAAQRSASAAASVLVNNEERVNTQIIVGQAGHVSYIWNGGKP